MSTTVSIRLPADLAKQLEDVARETERSKAFHIQKALETYMEDYVDLQIALDRLHDRTDVVISSKDMRKTLGI